MDGRQEVVFTHPMAVSSSGRKTMTSQTVGRKYCEEPNCGERSFASHQTIHAVWGKNRCGGIEVELGHFYIRHSPAQTMRMLQLPIPITLPIIPYRSKKKLSSSVIPSIAALLPATVMSKSAPHHSKRKGKPYSTPQIYALDATLSPHFSLGAIYSALLMVFTNF